jgi:hypothetical protein
LAQHGVYEGCLAVVNVGNDGDITDGLGHRGAFPSFGWADMAFGVGGQHSDQWSVVSDQWSDGLYDALSFKRDSPRTAASSILTGAEKSWVLAIFLAVSQEVN